MARKEEEKPIELSCEKDPEDPKHLVCVEANDGKGEKTGEIVEAEGKAMAPSPPGGQPNIIIGAINVGTEPVKEFFKSRWQRFYQEKQPMSRLHLIADVILLVAVISLITFNLIFLFKGKAVPPQAQVEFKAAVSSSEIALGKQAVLTLSYLNSEKSVLKEAKFILKFLNGLKVVSVEGGKWDPASSTIEIGEIESFDSGKVNVLLENTTFGKAEILAVFDFINPNGGHERQSRHLEISTPAVELKFLSYARYFSPEGEQLGRGPLPPKAGEVTKYQIYWVIEKPDYPLKDVRVEGVLADNVSWTGFTPLGKEKLKFDSLTRKVTWLPGEIKSGEEATSQGVVFEVALKPSEGQKGKEASLVNKIKASGREAVSGALLEREYKGITTDLVFDKKAQEKGSRVE